MKRFWQKDTLWTGIAAVVLSEILVGVLLGTGLKLAGESLYGHARWFVVMFVAALLVMRAYMKKKEYLNATKGAICAMFVTFVAFMTWLLKSHLIG